MTEIIKKHEINNLQFAHDLHLFAGALEYFGLASMQGIQPYDGFNEYVTNLANKLKQYYDLEPLSWCREDNLEWKKIRDIEDINFLFKGLFDWTWAQHTPQVWALKALCLKMGVDIKNDR